ncbi:MAG: hypothetical protein AMS16_07430 [Planctomycetes bacterium DG_58]|nr:MAG: hypothetical protein AMS16_07430 [Planctomycetes bacterium DG_58]
MIYNAANMLTLSRLVMAAIFFVLIAFKSWWAVPMLVLAGATDLLDGWVARRYNQQTDFGRIADPVIDKVLICGGFIFLVKHAPTIVMSWMATVIVGRELVVTGLRSLAESRGTEFAATFWGKSKMAVQSVALGWVILLITVFKPAAEAARWMVTTAHVLVWTAVVVTVMSGLVYLIQAEKLVRGREEKDA